MFGKMEPEFAAQFNVKIPTYLEYAKVVAGTMSKHYANIEKKPLLISEPGTTIISNYISLITKVVQKKVIREKEFVTVDSSFYNAGDVCLVKQLPYYVLDKNLDIKLKNNSHNTSIMGYTCLEQDCLVKKVDIELEVGDIVVLGNVGGYSIVSKPPFIQPNVAMYTIKDNKEDKKIKRRENFNDIYETFMFDEV